jgi:5-methylcytosine-specific restriction endonuclease McrA
MKYSCITCGKSFEANRYKHRKYCSHKCQPAWNKGVPITEEAREKTRLGVLKRYAEDPTYRQRVSEATKKSITPEMNKKNSERTKLLWQDEEYRRKFAITAHRNKSGKNHWHYIDGSTMEHRPLEWNVRLKRIIRERDNRTCQICDRTESELKKQMVVHHIDGDKFNQDHSNLISLCAGCHTMVHEKMRGHNAKYSEKIMAIIRI